MVKIYISGCGGALGDALYEEFKDSYALRCTDIITDEPWLSRIDITDEKAYRKDVEQFSPDILFHVGACTDLEWCECHPEETYLVNADSVKSAVEIANSLDIPILYVSSAAIFGGAKGIFSETDEANPKSVYAQSKYLGESYVRGKASRYLICRAGWMMGGGPTKDKKFVNRIIRQLVKGERELNIVGDTCGSLTYTRDFARTIRALINNQQWGTYNCACKGTATRPDICRALLYLLGMNDKVTVNIIESKAIKEDYYAMRPKSECLSTKKLDGLGLNLSREWECALRDYIEKDFDGLLHSVNLR